MSRREAASDPLTNDLASAVVRELHEKRWCRCPDFEPMLCVESVEVVRSVLNDGRTPSEPSPEEQP